MRKFTIPQLVVILVLIGMAVSWAAPVVIQSPDGQRDVEISGDRLSVNTAGRSNGLHSVIGSGWLHLGPCWVQSIHAYGSVNDTIGFYNALSGYDLDGKGIEYELKIGANDFHASANPGGAYFDRGLYVFSSNTTTLITAVWDY